MKLKEYTPEDFSEVNVLSVADLDINRQIGERVVDFAEAKSEMLVEYAKQAEIELSEENVSLQLVERMSVENAAVALQADEHKLGKDMERLYDEYSLNEERVETYNQIIKLVLPEHSKQNVLDTVKELEKREDVLYADLNYYYHSNGGDHSNYNDALIGIQLPIIERLQLDDAWEITRGNSNVKVGVIDSGIYQHSDLEGNLDSNISYAHKADPFYDDENHGTIVAGIIGAKGGNEEGLAGVCWDVDLISLKVNTDENGVSKGSFRSQDYILEAFQYATEKGIDILNCSFSTYERNPYINYAVRTYDGLVVCAAGNDNVNIDQHPQYPASFSYDNIISVAATDMDDNLVVLGEYSGSNYGEKSVDLAAPGYNVPSATNADDYTFINFGTSFAAPFVSGTAALIKSLYPNMTAAGLKGAILNGVDSVDSLEGKVLTGGRLNVYNALVNAQNQFLTIKYYRNGGSGLDMENQTFKYGIPTNLQKSTFKKYIPAKTAFAGWYACEPIENKWLYSKGDKREWRPSGEYTDEYQKCLLEDEEDISALYYPKNHNLVRVYAQWRPYRYFLYYCNKNNHNSVKYSETTPYNETYTITTHDFKWKTGYKVDSWIAERNSDGKYYYTNGTDFMWCDVTRVPSGYYIHRFATGEQVSNLSNIDNDIIYMYPQRQPYAFTLKFDSNGGTGNMPTYQCATNQHINLPPNAFIKNGYLCEGWRAVDSDEYWYAENNGTFDWYDGLTQDQLDSGYNYVFYEDKGDFSCIVDEDDLTVTLVAQWISKSSIIKGDINRDGVLTMEDVTLLQNYLTSIVDLNEVQLYAGDVNNSGTVTISDVTALKKLIS